MLGLVLLPTLSPSLLREYGEENFPDKGGYSRSQSVGSIEGFREEDKCYPDSQNCI